MAGLDLSDLIAGANENLGIEFKAWMDTRDNEARAKLARHLAAIANHGGGYLIFGVDDKTRKPLGTTELGLTLFGQDAISDIVKKYLEPRFQVTVEHVQHDGVTYPIVVVPPHGARPVIAIADGPSDDRKNPVGVRQGTIYIRRAGPESAPIRNADDWNALLERCLCCRADIVGKILRQSMARQSKPDNRIRDLLSAAVNDAAEDFTKQTRLLADRVKPEYREAILKAGTNYSALGYALVDPDGDLIEVPNIRALNDRISVAMHRYAFYGWGSFLPLNVPERAPQIRMSTLADREVTYLEGMRVENTTLISGGFDYWRIYECGIGVSVESFRDDGQGQSIPQPHLTLMWIMVAFHSLLAHARLMGQELPGVAQVVIRMDWRGLKGRMLGWDSFRHANGGATVADDRFSRTVTLDWADLRDDYFSTLRRVALPFLSLFASSGWFDPESWFTREAVNAEFKRLGVKTTKLFEDE